ncbi:hypothetical protein [Dongia sp.]|uniref:hypothetical protein n=1 Tax=Dongia sp. TaxID=1977262 RepID=UPI0035AFF83C
MPLRAQRFGAGAFTAMAFALAIGTSGHSVRAEEPQGEVDAERLLGEGMATLLRGLELLLKSVPQYAPPEVMPNGDIIIRRLHPEEDEDGEETAPDDRPNDAPQEDSTET